MVTYNHLGKYDPCPLAVDTGPLNTLASHNV